jgi:hypothetical protein
MVARRRRRKALHQHAGALALETLSGLLGVGWRDSPEVVALLIVGIREDCRIACGSDTLWLEAMRHAEVIEGWEREAREKDGGKGDGSQATA